MPEEIDIPKVPLSRTEQYLTKIVKELSGSDEEVEIPKTTLSRVEMYLKAIINLLAEAAVKKPITVKGMVNSKDELEGIENPQVGDMYFVKVGDKSEEFIYNTEGKWDPVGDTSVDLSDYLTADDIRDPLTTKFGEVDGEISQLQDDYAEVEETYVKEEELLYPYTDNTNKYLAPFNGNHTMDHPGLVLLASANSCGISCNGLNESGQLYLFDGGNAEVDKESSNTIALHPNNIPRMMSNYGITSKDYLSKTYMTIAEGNSFVHKNEIADERKFGVVALDRAAGGITSNYGNVLCINRPTDDEITSNKVNLQSTALTLDRIPAVFNHYGIPGSGFMNTVYTAVSSNTRNLNKKVDSVTADETYATKEELNALTEKVDIIQETYATGEELDALQAHTSKFETDITDSVSSLYDARLQKGVLLTDVDESGITDEGIYNQPNRIILSAHISENTFYVESNLCVIVLPTMFYVSVSDIAHVPLVQFKLLDRDTLEPAGPLSDIEIEYYYIDLLE